MRGPGGGRGIVGSGQGAAPVRAACRREVALRAGMLGIRRGRGHPFDHCVHSVRPTPTGSAPAGRPPGLPARPLDAPLVSTYRHRAVERSEQHSAFT
ncbi:hypothetical protein DMH12_01515 [Streptomyces sp. WAC 04229]|nr:hypothetical protein DMH12_01515 [Streptomyces sp. WAC 04229]